MVLARPITPGMSISINGKPASFSVLSEVLPMVKVPAGASGALEVHYSLPHSRFIVLLVIAGLFAMLILTTVSARKPQEI